ncbi:MAG: ATP-binding cassette domain-containing protein [Alphaproteobacteria bacterium]|nr:ATP-binding cassette domain-containing protein [Alphaproteobacteria bacterium]
MTKNFGKVRVKNAAISEATDSPVMLMMNVLQEAGYRNFCATNSWEKELCALVLTLEPHCKTYRLLEALPQHNRPFDQADVLNALAHLGYRAHSAKTKIKDIDARLFPCLFVARNGNSLVLTGRDQAVFKVYGAQGSADVRLERLEQGEGRIWIFERFDENAAPTSKFMRAGSGSSWFRALCGRFNGTIGQVMVAGLMLNLIALSTPIFILLVYDRVIAAGSLETLPMLATGVVIALLCEMILRKIRSRGLSWLAARMDNIVGNKIFTHLIGLPPSLVERASVAAQIARIKTFESIRDFFSGSVFLSLLEMPFVVLAAVAIFMISGPLVLVPLFMVGAYGVLFYVVYRKVRVAIRLAAKNSSARQQFTIETFEKIRAVRGYGLTSRWQSKFRDLSGREMLAHFHLGWLGMVAETVAHAFTVISAVATIGFGAHLIWTGGMSTGALVAVMILVWRVLTPFYSLCTMIPRLEQLRNSIIQINMLMDLDTEAMEAKTAARLPRIKGAVRFSHVSMRYAQDGDAVFRDLNFEARPGDLVAITGQNGSGKSSLLKLVKSLYKVQEGSVQIDGFDIRQLDAPDLRRHIAYVPQQPDFFRGSILDNLRIGNPLASEQDIRQALVHADAWDDVSKLMDDVETLIGRYGVETLPQGLLARLSLARAYLHPSPIVLIDELPNMLLGGKAGENLKKYLADIRGKRTVFLVTYREDFMRMADTIVTLRRGVAPMAGPREKILETLLEDAA